MLTSHFLLNTATPSSVMFPCFSMSAGLILVSKLLMKLSRHSLNVLA